MVSGWPGDLIPDPASQAQHRRPRQSRCNEVGRKPARRVSPGGYMVPNASHATDEAGAGIGEMVSGSVETGSPPHPPWSSAWWER